LPLASRIIATWSTSGLSKMSAASMRQKPKTALVGVPSGRFIGGNA
jgi:hypothetical protein